MISYLFVTLGVGQVTRFNVGLGERYSNDANFSEDQFLTIHVSVKE